MAYDASVAIASSSAFVFGWHKGARPLPQGLLVVSGLSHRMSLRLLSVVGAVLIGAGQIACFLLDSLMLIIPVLACCVGLGSALSTVVDETAVHLHFSTARRRRAYNLYYTAFSLSAIASPLLISTLVDKYGLNGALLLSGAVSLNALAGSMLMNRQAFLLPVSAPCAATQATLSSVASYPHHEV
ncbi:uncharacterized protein LOC144144886 [Haemaphysalis longicornis]